MTMTPDWSKILDEADAEPAFAPLPAAPYPIVVDEASVVQAGTGSWMVKVIAKVTEGPYEDRLLFTNLVFKTDSPAGMRMTLRKLVGLGCSREWLITTQPSLDQIAAQVAGARAIAQVKQTTYEGELRNEIGGFRPLTEAKPVIGYKPVGEPDGDAPVVPPPPVVTDEDIPVPDPF